LELLNEGFDKARCRSEPGQKTLGARTRTNNKLNPLMTPGRGIEPGPHWWEASAITTAPSLLPRVISATRVLANAKERFKDALTTSDRILAMEH